MAEHRLPIQKEHRMSDKKNLVGGALEHGQMCIKTGWWLFEVGPYYHAP
jgi:hypothetical protein